MDTPHFGLIIYFYYLGRTQIEYTNRLSTKFRAQCKEFSIVSMRPNHRTSTGQDTFGGGGGGLKTQIEKAAEGSQTRHGNKSASQSSGTHYLLYPL